MDFCVGVVILFIVGTPICALCVIIVSMIQAGQDMEGYCTKHGIPLPKNYQQYTNNKDNGLDEAYLLFMGDAVLRSNHPEATAAQQEYYNDNHNCEAW